MELLLQAEKARTVTANLGTSADQPALAGEANSATAEVPYIEVGGPGRLLDASPMVLAAGGRRPSAWKQSSLPARPQSIPLPTACSTQMAGPLMITFRPVAPLAVIGPPQERFAAELITFHKPDHFVSEQYRSLLAGIAAQAPVGGAQVLLFTAATGRTGTTTVLLNLAVTIAKQDKRVAVVDANWRRPAIAERLGLNPGPGLADVLRGAAPWSRTLRETGQTNLLALVGAEPNRVSETGPHGEALRGLLCRLRRHFEWILIDGASWDGGPEIAALSAACDAVFLVLRPTEVETTAVAELVRLLTHLGGYVGGYILTQQ
jgi:Mrp family chromosome partitioning ATPase